MSEIAERLLLDTSLVSLRDIRCDGTCRHRSELECTTETAIVLPYRGLFVRHVGQEDAVGEANQMLFFNKGQEYSISHPVSGGDACLSFAIDKATLHELVPRTSLHSGSDAKFKMQAMRIGPVVQSAAAWLRHGVHRGSMEPLEAESLALSVIRHDFRDETRADRGATPGKRRLVDRAKIVLASQPFRRWTLSDIGREVGCSPVYLTQLFRQIERMPLYRYQLRLRLAAALDEIAECDDLTMLALDLGFSSHSHFTAAFRATYGRSPSAFREMIGRQRSPGTATR